MINLNKEAEEIIIKYSPAGVEVGLSSNKSVKINKVVLKYQDQSDCVQFLKCFYSIQKIRIDNRGKGTSKRRPRVI